MPHSVSNSNQFLSYYNQIDEYFTILLEIGTYIPFSEKIDQIVHGQYSVSGFVKQHYHKLKYFSEMRNQIVHGFRLDHEHYLLASDIAVKEIKQLYGQLISPPTVDCLLGKAIVFLDKTQTVREVVSIMLRDSSRVLPLYDEGEYVTTLILDDLVGLLLKGDENALISEHLTDNSPHVLFLSPGTSIYNVESLFLKQHAPKSIEVIWITEDGTNNTPIIGKITAQDLPKLYQMSILSEII